MTPPLDLGRAVPWHPSWFRILAGLMVSVVALTLLGTRPSAAAELRSGRAAVHRERAIGDSLRRPRLRNPIRIRLSVGPDFLRLDDHRDYILRMPRRKKTGVLSIQGGRNIWVIGGYFSVTGAAENIYIRDGRDAVRGRVVHLEGLLIDGSSGGHADGMKIAAPRAIVQIRFCRIVGLHGSRAGIHADVVQPFGGVRALRIDGLTASSHYNNLYLRRENDPLGPPIGKVVVRNTDIFGYVNPPGSVPASTIRAISIGTQGIPPSDDGDAVNCELTSKLILRNFYADPPPGKRLGQFVHPHDRMPGGASWCAARQARHPRRVDWPRLRDDRGGLVSGVVRGGLPPGGHFVPKWRVGLDYRR